MKKYTNTMLITICAGLFWACTDAKHKQETEAQHKTMTVAKSDQTLQTQYTARLAGRQIVEIRPQVSGTLTRICINEGDKVRKGQTLFIIDQVPYQAALNVAKAAVTTAEAKLATARMNYENDQQLQSGQVVSEYVVKTSLNALHEAEATLEQAKAQEINARNNLSYTVVKSPVDGVASMIPWHVGALVGSTINEPLVTVADDHDVQAYFSITDKQSLALISQYGSLEAFRQQAPAVSLLLSNGMEYAHQGHIDAVSGTVDQQTGSVTLRATFPNPEHLLHNGGAATILLPTYKKNVIVVPQSATYELQNRSFVYRIVDGKTKATPVTLFPLNNGKEFIVEEGLTEGDEIICEGAGLLKEGVEVKAEKSKKVKK